MQTKTSRTRFSLPPTLLKLTVLPAALLAPGAGMTLAQSISMTIPGQGQVVAGSDIKQSLRCNGAAMTVNGNSIILTLSGSCTQLTVNGNRNVITAATVGRIEANGNGNTVFWHQGLGGKKPTVRSIGSGNKIAQR